MAKVRRKRKSTVQIKFTPSIGYFFVRRGEKGLIQRLRRSNLTKAQIEKAMKKPQEWIDV